MDVDTIAIRVSLDVVYRQPVHAARNNGEPAAVEEQELADDDVAAVLQANRLVSAAARCLIVVVAHQPTAMNETWPADRHVLDAFTPQERVVPMAVAEVLIHIERIDLGFVVRP